VRTVLALALLLAAPPLGAQAAPRPAPRVDPSPADRAIAAGRLAEAESALYAATRGAPRDPGARGALGAFLAARGRLKVGAVLLEEARQFGGDARVIDERLRHIYAWLGEWHQAPTEPGAPRFGRPERLRVQWLATHPPTRQGPDSSVVALEPNELAGLGRVTIGIGNTVVRADIDPNVEGLVLAPTLELLDELQRFGTRGDTTLAVAYIVTLGEQSLSNVPVTLEPEARSRVGLDVLAPLVPTFDLAARRLTLHASAKEPARGEALAILLGFPGVRLVARPGQSPVALESAAGRAALRGARWTFDLRRGAVVVER